MLQSVLITVLIAGSAFAMRLDYLKGESAEDDIQSLALEQYYGSEGEALPKNGLNPFCWACKWVFQKVKKQLTTDAKAEVIKEKLLHACDQIGLFKDKCKKMVAKYMNVLIDELSTTDYPQTACTNIGICKSKPI